jgi:AraC-like DNA-binding protein
MTTVPIHYVPKSLNPIGKATQKRELRKSRRMYKRGIYHTRKSITGYRSKKSVWDSRLRRTYNIPQSEQLTLDLLAKKTGCSKRSLQDIVKKGMGAYYSSGSRPNQTAHSWGYARLYSALTGGPAAKVDNKILRTGCKIGSKVIKLSNSPSLNSTRKKVMLGGYKMHERIVRFEKSPIEGKKYRAIVKHLITGKERHIDFGASDYQQYKDRTGIGLYSHKNHGTRKRMRNYFNRHSGTPNRKKAIKKERSAADGMYNAKILSHEYLW